MWIFSEIRIWLCERRCGTKGGCCPRNNKKIEEEFKPEREDKGGESGKIIYVTAAGEKYHTIADCRSLRHCNVQKKEKCLFCVNAEEEQKHLEEEEKQKDIASWKSQSSSSGKKET